MKRALLLLVPVIILIWGCAKEEGGTPVERPALVWYASLDEARLKAQDRGDLVLMSFGAGWCPWTRLVRESLYVNQTIIESLATLRCVQIDADSDSTLTRLYGITVFPTTVVTDAYGSEIGRIVGYQAPDDFLERLMQMKRREDVLAGMFRQEETSADDPIFLLAFGRLLAEIGMYDAALIRFDRAEKLDEDDRYGALEEATYSLAETYMLAGDYKEAGRRFSLFAEANETSPRAEMATVLAGLCYQQVDYYTRASQIYEEYLEVFPQGEFKGFVQANLDSLKARRQRAG